MAIRLDKAFGGGAKTWLRKEMSHDLALAMRKAAAIRVKRYSPKAA